MSRLSFFGGGLEQLAKLFPGSSASALRPRTGAPLLSHTDYYSTALLGCLLNTCTGPEGLQQTESGRTATD